MTVTSQQRGLPSCHGIRDRPSGLLPSDLILLLLLLSYWPAFCHAWNIRILIDWLISCSKHPAIVSACKKAEALMRIIMVLLWREGLLMWLLTVCSYKAELQCTMWRPMLRHSAQPVLLPGVCWRMWRSYKEWLLGLFICAVLVSSKCNCQCTFDFYYCILKSDVDSSGSEELEERLCYCHARQCSVWVMCITGIDR